MIGPTVASGIEQRDNLPGSGIDAGQVRAFAENAAVTGKSQIPGIISPAMLAGHDVLDVMSQ